MQINALLTLRTPRKGFKLHTYVSYIPINMQIHTHTYIHAKTRTGTVHIVNVISAMRSQLCCPYENVNFNKIAECTEIDSRIICLFVVEESERESERERRREGASETAGIK